MVLTPKVTVATEYGNAASFWVEYPNGLVDFSRSTHLPKGEPTPGDVVQDQTAGEVPIPSLAKDVQLDISVDGDRLVRVAKKQSAIVIVDMQK